MSRRLRLVVLVSVALLVVRMVALGQNKPSFDLYANWGPKLNTSGVTIELQRRPDISVAGQAAADYRMVVHGAPAGARFAVVLLRVGQSQPAAVDAITLEASGLADNGPDSPMDLDLLGAKGEPFRFAIVSADGKTRAFAPPVIPFPLEGRDHSCALTVELGSADDEVVLIHGAGFASGETVTTRISSGPERLGSKITVDGSGEFLSPVLPAVKGLDAGVLHFQATGSGCSPSVEVPWGKGSYKVQ